MKVRDAEDRGAIDVGRRQLYAAVAARFAALAGTSLAP